MHPPDDTPGGRAALLRRLRDDQFVPPEAWAAVANGVCVGATVPVTRDAREDESAALASDVEALAAGYWSLPPAARRARWCELSARCDDDPLAGRLRRLESGLDLEPAAHADTDGGELAELVRELYVLPPRTRAVRRAGWLADRADDRADWVAAARRFRVRDPATAALGGDIVDRLGRPPVAAVPKSLEARQRLGLSHYLMAALFATALLYLGYGLVQMAAESRPPPRVPPPVKAEPVDWYRVRDGEAFTAAQVGEYREYEKSLARGPARSPPTGYERWVRGGRPDPVWIPTTTWTPVRPTPTSRK